MNEEKREFVDYARSVIRKEWAAAPEKISFEVVACCDTTGEDVGLRITEFLMTGREGLAEFLNDLESKIEAHLDWCANREFEKWDAHR